MGLGRERQNYLNARTKFESIYGLFMDIDSACCYIQCRVFVINSVSSKMMVVEKQ